MKPPIHEEHAGCRAHEEAGMQHHREGDAMCEAGEGAGGRGGIAVSEAKTRRACKAWLGTSCPISARGAEALGKIGFFGSR